MPGLGPSHRNVDKVTEGFTPVAEGNEFWVSVCGRFTPEQFCPCAEA